MNFPISKEYIYFDSARSSGMYQELLKWRNNHDNLLLKKGSQLRINHEDFVDNFRKGIASFFHSSKANVYMTQSFSTGFKSLLNILDYNLNFLIIENDYPTIEEQLKFNGFNYDVIVNADDFEQTILNGLEKYKPNVLVLSIVQYINGLLVDLNFLKEIKIKYPKLLIIADGTQFCGTKDFNFKNSSIDVLISSGYKWLFSGYGNGFLLVKKKIVQAYLNVESKKFAEKSFSLAFEPGNIDTLNFGSLLFSINKISEYGIFKIENRLNLLSNYAKKKFIEKKLLDKQILNRKEHSNIFNLRGGIKIFNKLIENKIICSIRGNGIRVSFNIYNQEKEIDYLLTFFK